MLFIFIPTASAPSKSFRVKEDFLWVTCRGRLSPMTDRFPPRLLRGPVNNVIQAADPLETVACPFRIQVNDEVIATKIMKTICAMIRGASAFQ